MSDKLLISELECFVWDDPPRGKERLRKRGFTLAFFPTEGLRSQIRSYLLEKGKQVGLLTMERYIARIHHLGHFFSDKYPMLSDILEVPEEELIHSLKKWMLANGKKIKVRASACMWSYMHDERDICLLRSIYAFLRPKDDRPEEEKDVWTLKSFPFPIKDNPISPQRTLDFRGIPQERMRSEIKRVCLLLIRFISASQARLIMIAGRHLAVFLHEHAPDVLSFTEIDRTLIEAYLLYIKKVLTNQTTVSNHLQCLKRLLIEISKMEDAPDLAKVMYPQDIPRIVSTIYRAYSDEELERLHFCIAHLPPQMARAMVLHELLGCRISETLTLKWDCLIHKDGEVFIRIDQVKTERSYLKVASDKMVQLVNASIAYTKENFGERRYIFVKPKNPDDPMRYQSLGGAIRRVVYKYNLRNDRGEYFGIGTHLFRHTYGQKLTEMGFEDEVIAKLLGHTSLGTVHRYRKMSPKTLASQTRVMRDDINAMITETIKEWDDEEL